MSKVIRIVIPDDAPWPVVGNLVKDAENLVTEKYEGLGAVMEYDPDFDDEEDED